MSVGCRYFADGNCLYGDKCKYGHNYPPASSFPNAQVTGSEYNRTMAPGMSPSYMYQDGAERNPEGYYDPQYSSDYYGGYSGDPAYGAATYGSGMGTGSAAYNYSSGMIKQNPMDPIAAQGNSWDSRIVVTQGGTTYFYPTDNSPGGTESQNRYMPSLPHIGSSPGQRTLRSFFVNEDIRNEFHKRATETLTVLDQNDSWAMRLPSLVVRYHSLYPLDKIDADKSVKVFGQITHLFKCINMNDRLPYVMRRIDGVHITNETATTIVAQWRKAQHPGIVNLREILTTTEFAETSVIFIYDYHPRSVTLADEYFTRSRIPVEEDIIWSYLVQLVSILRLIHEKKLACRVIHPSKVIITGKNRIRVSGVGILDALNYDKQESSPDFQKEDLIALGQLLLCICTRKANACDDIGISLEYIGSKYSKELVEIITNLISMKISSIDQINSPTFINHLYKDSVNLQHYTDFLESEVSKELESGRLFRLIAKLAFINDRPEYQRNPAWSESGDKYVLTLFRDYVFHQVYESGAPSVDMAHVIDTLNKLDAGSAEKIVLVSRNETVVMTVSYQDIKACLESAFKELQMTKATY